MIIGRTLKYTPIPYRLFNNLNRPVKINYLKPGWFSTEEYTFLIPNDELNISPNTIEVTAEVLKQSADYMYIESYSIPITDLSPDNNLSDFIKVEKFIRRIYVRAGFLEGNAWRDAYIAACPCIRKQDETSENYLKRLVPG